MSELEAQPNPNTSAPPGSSSSEEGRGGARAPVVTELLVATPPPTTPRLLSGDEDEELDRGQRYEISGNAFRKRIERDRRALLKDLAGTDDVEAVRARLNRLTELEAGEEEQRRATLAAEERLREDLARAEDRRAAAEAKAENVENERQVEREAQRVRSIASRYIDGDYVEDILWGHFKQHLAKLDEDELASFDDNEIEDWFREYAEKRPKFARDAAVVAAVVPAVRVPLTNGLRADQRPAPMGGQVEAKTARPNQPNSMTKAEIKAKYGVSW